MMGACSHWDGAVWVVGGIYEAEWLEVHQQSTYVIRAYLLGPLLNPDRPDKGFNFVLVTEEPATSSLQPH